jgi:hypothetical protein
VIVSPAVAVAPPTLILTPSLVGVTATSPLLHVVVSALPFGSDAPAFEQVSGRVPEALALITMLQVYSTDPSGIGVVFENDSTSARTPVQAAPLQPEGWKAKVVAPLFIAGFTLQSGWPFIAAIGEAAWKAMSFCVSATIDPSVESVTERLCVDPGAPETDPTWIATACARAASINATDATNAARSKRFCLITCRVVSIVAHRGPPDYE